MNKSSFAAAALLLVIGCSEQLPESVQTVTEPTFLGSDQCASCHEQEHTQWTG